MKLAIAQLSDIHLDAEHNPIESRIAEIAHSIASRVDLDVSLCLIAMSGDVAATGEEEEYIRALDFCTTLRDRILALVHRDCKVEFVAIPGNHDCNFRTPHAARDLLTNGLVNKNPSTVDASTIEVCCEPQQSFFEFRDLFAGSQILLKGSHLYYEYRIGDEDVPDVLIKCLNSAWLSQLHEKPGSLFFPVDQLPVDGRSAGLVVTMLHHPYNWFSQTNARALKKRLESTSDILLTGHEHDFSVRTQRGGLGEHNVYIEGGFLQERSEPDASTFNLIVVDTIARKQRVIAFRWLTDVYQVAYDSDWTEYQVGALRNSCRFVLTEEFSKYLDDPGVTLVHTVKGALKLSDFFVYPDVREVSYLPGQMKPVSRGELLLELAAERERLLITAVDQSGKTSLAKRLVSDYHAKGLVPILINGPDVKCYDDDRMIKELVGWFIVQYEKADRERYLQLPRTQRIVVIDDYHKMRLRKAALDGFIRQLTGFASQVILLSGDITHHLLDIAGPAAITDPSRRFFHYRILQYGHVRRNELTERWLALDDELLRDDDRYARRVMDVKRTTDTAIGRNFLPSYPVFILPILQAQDTNEQVDLHASTYGYYYELMIRRSLAASSTREGFDIKLGYLSHLARAMLLTGESVIPDQMLRKLHSDYEDDKLITIPYAPFLHDLVKAGVLDSDGDSFWFKYRYIYYYFVASHLRDHITETDTQVRIEALAVDLHEEENANTLLFLAHLSKHPFIIEQMLKAAARVFPDAPVAELQKEVDALGVLSESVDQIVYIDRGPEAELRS